MAFNKPIHFKYNSSMTKKIKIKGPICTTYHVVLEFHRNQSSAVLQVCYAHTHTHTRSAQRENCYSAAVPPVLSSNIRNVVFLYLLGHRCLSSCSFTANHDQNDYSNYKSQYNERCSSNHSKSIDLNQGLVLLW